MLEVARKLDIRTPPQEIGYVGRRTPKLKRRDPLVVYRVSDERLEEAALDKAFDLLFEATIAKTRNNAVDGPGLPPRGVNPGFSTLIRKGAHS